MHGQKKGADMKHLKKPTEAIVLVISYVVLIAANMLGEAFRFVGVTAGDISNEVFAWFAPAGYVFAIWSLIYIGLIIWIIRLIRDNQHNRALPFLPISIEAALFAISCVLNIAWLAFWHLRVFPATIPIIIALLVVVAILYFLTWQRSKSPIDRVPLAIYTSWLVIATIANIAHVATRETTSDAGLIPVISTLVLLIALVVATYVVRRIFNEYAFGLVVAWAGIGIGVRIISLSPIIGVVIILVSTIGIAAALIPWENITIKRKANNPLGSTSSTK